MTKNALTARAAELLCWYDAHKRQMPWRDDPTPYHVWVSEIMLQQTRVEAVRGYYDRFLVSLPDIAALAACPEDDLLKLWEGLGYYSRVRNLQKAAKLVVEHHDGHLPGDFEALRALPGIGEYTAGAIASIAFGHAVPAVDGNVIRVLTRLLGIETPVADAKSKKTISGIAQSMIPPSRAGDFNQSLMELGAIICLPNGAPLCGSCPWQESCAAKKDGSWEKIPALPPKKPRTIEERTVALILSDGALLLSRRPQKGLLAGLPEPLNLAGTLPEEELLAQIRALGGMPQSIEAMGSAKHIFTHIEWRMTGFCVRCSPFAPPEGFFFADRAALEDKVAIPSAFRAFMEKLPARLNDENPAAL